MKTVAGAGGLYSRGTLGYRVFCLVKSFASSLYAFALAVGGPGLFVIAFLDSSFVSLPQVNDVLVVLMVIAHKTWMPYYAAMATLGSVDRKSTRLNSSHT